MIKYKSLVLATLMAGLLALSFAGPAQGRGFLLSGQAANRQLQIPPDSQSPQTRPGRGIGREAGLQGAPPGQGPAARPGDLVLSRPAILQMLNLSEDQWARIRDIRQRYAPQVQTLRMQMMDARDALRQVVYGESLDQNLLEQRMREFLDKQNEVLRLGTRIEIELRQVLTPEQLSKFRQIQNEEMEIRRMQREILQREQKLREQLRPTTKPPSEQH